MAKRAWVERAIVTVLLGASAMPALAQGSADDQRPAIRAPLHRDTALRIRGSGWFSRADGTLVVGDEVPQFPAAIRELDLRDTLNLDTDETVFWGEVALHFGRGRRWMIGGGYSGPFRYSGRSEPLQIAFRDRVYQGQVVSDAKFDIYEINAGYEILRGSRHSLRLGVATRLFDVEAALEGTAVDPQTGATQQRRESVRALAPIPGPALDLRLHASERLYVRGRAGGIWLGDLGHFVDASAEIGYELSRNLGVFGGYRWIRAEADVREIDFELNLHGVYAGAEIRF
jgi:hypothetical protein